MLAKIEKRQEIFTKDLKELRKQTKMNDTLEGIKR